VHNFLGKSLTKIW